AKRRVGAKSTAHKDVIAFDLVAVFGLLHLAGEQSDLADEVLGAGVVTPGEMDVDRCVDRYSRLAPGCDLVGVALGIGSRKLASGIAGAGDEAGAQRVRPRAQAKRLDGGASCRAPGVRPPRAK